MLRNFRPSKIEEVFGQDHIIKSITPWLQNTEVMPNSILFAGHYGCGKTTLARILAYSLTTNPNDVTEINAAEARGIDDVRGWIEQANLSGWGGYKTFIIDELHQMTNAAQSALLKVIEEPPKKVKFFLCTTEPGKLLDTIRSRCHKLTFNLLNQTATRQLVEHVLQVSPNQLSDDLIYQIHAKTNGHARDIVKILDLVNPSNDVNTIVASLEETVKSNTYVSYQQVRGILEKIIYHGQGQTVSSEELGILANNVDDYTLNSAIDESINHNFLKSEKMKRSFPSMLEVKAWNKEYKVTVQDRYYHFLTCFL